MTKNLKWRLKQLPTGDEVAKLVEQKVITKEEARSLLFSKTKQDDEPTIEALKKQIEFLEELVRDLARGVTPTSIIHIHDWHRWEPYKVTWTTTSGNTGTGVTFQNYSSNLLSN